MKNKITLSLCLLLIISTLSAQSKKELDLRIDTLQTGISATSQVVQTLTVQAQNLVSEMEKMNKIMGLLTTQLLKQDSMNTLISGEIQGLNRKTTEIQRLQDSIRSIEATAPVVKANLKMRLFSQSVNKKGKLLLTEMTKLSSEDNYYFLCYDNSDEIEKIQIEGIGENISITIKDMSFEGGKLIYDKPNIQINGMFVIPKKDIKIEMGSTNVITIKQGKTIIIEETIRSGGCH
jgi:uncharacterized coiled-coil protein SlyX